MREAVIVEAVRTPVGRRKGGLSGIRADDLAALALREVLDRVDLNPALVEDVIMGCVTQAGEQAACVGRHASLIAGYPPEVPSVTIDRQCGSSQQSVHFAAQAILAGDMDIVVAAGVEHMTRVPMGTAMMNTPFSPTEMSLYNIVPQGLSAEYIAEKWQIPRNELDEFSLASHEKAIAAQDKGWFDNEIMPVDVTLDDGSTAVLTRDEGPRRGSSLEKLASLRTAFKENGVITAGNASQLSDGAVAVLVMSAEKARELGLKPRAKVLARAVVGSDPVLALTGTIPATYAVLKKAGLKMEDIDIFEVNEAFAPVPIAWLRETGANPAKLNPCGGAIALGHPLGASGGRIICTLLNHMERTGARYGLHTMCEAFGMSNATIFERLD
ncbi:MAG TPA: acetyl-CoA C-acyltransferase [Desulfotomaculum sp.]|nr:MAG: acetyl-CoA acetyltransferase [Peptococcaceae bacterium BRH_c8a]KJS75830.1 MAG: acetyl-CoA acetyltransferase [Desulfotomaculum sp. BICA1-6]HBX24491.1 acetyl-CoA C-acyltransferase [Desulfotomaculum sp.]